MAPQIGGTEQPTDGAFKYFDDERGSARTPGGENGRGRLGEGRWADFDWWDSCGCACECGAI